MSGEAGATQPTDLVPLVSSTQEYEAAIASGGGAGGYELVLFVAGAAPRSLRAVATLRRLCEEHLPGRHDLQVVDIYQDPGAAETEGIVAVPALIKKLPLPVSRLVGDMSDVGRVLEALGIGSPSPGGSAG